MAGVDFGTNLGAAIARDSVCAAIREAQYCFQFKSFVKALRDEKEDLIARSEKVQDHAKKAKEETKKIDTADDKWLKVAEILIADAGKLEEKATNSKCYCLRSCPNWIGRYCLAKQIEKKTKAMLDHKNKEGNKFKQFDRLLTLPGMEYYSNEGFIYFNSTKVAYDKIIDALKDDEVDMVGLYGMGGCGKTTLAHEVGKEAEHLFDKVLFLSVTSTVDVRKIQGKIAGSLRLILKEEDEAERARRLWLRLTSCGERILITLDDVWEKLDFKAIGIPFGGDQKGCKVLLTTRLRQICHLMGCKRQISLSLLSEEEAWTLFQKHAGRIDDALNGLAREITKECKGLPVAIAAVASTLKGKAQSDWEVALETLRESRRVDVENGLENPHTCLKLSYDNLRNKEAEQFFLLCCLFPEDWEIPLEHLTRIGIGLGLVGEVHSYRRSRNKVSTAINKLIDSCLLLGDNEEQCVKMHDLVRGVGLTIAKKEIQAVIWPQMFEKTFKAATVKDSSIRYLWCNMAGNFPNQLDFPNLEFLNVFTDIEQVELPNDIFQGMKELRVLILANQSDGKEKPMLRLSKPIQSLKNLRYLVLFGWALGDISFLGSLETLQALTLQSCSFHELPNEIVHLTNLRLLDLSECQSKINPYTVVGRCSQLEELYFIGNECPEWENQVEEDAAVFSDKNIVDLGALRRYHLEIGTSFELFDSGGFYKTRFLSVQYFDASTSNATIKNLMQKSEVLFLGNIHRGCKNIIPDLVQTIGGGITDLVELVLYDSDILECLIDNANHSSQLGPVFSKLVRLRISGMERLETLCNGPPPPGVFEKLERTHIMDCSRLYGSLFVGNLNLCNLKALELRNCPMLTCLLTPTIAESLVLLESLEIKECNGLKHIITNEEGEIISDYIHHTPLFPKLKDLVVEECKQLENFIPVSYVHGLVHLESLQITRCPRLKYIFGEYNHENQLPSYQNHNEFQVINFPALKSLWLEDLANTKGICPENCYPLWPSLHESYFLDCPNLNILSVNNSVVISEVSQQVHTITEEIGPIMHMDNEVSTLQTVKNVETLWVRDCKIQGIFQLAGLTIDEKLHLSYLHDLYLNNLVDLKFICRGPPQSINLHNLESLEVHECGNLKYIFSTCIAEGLPQLKELTISFCDQLEHIIEDEEHLNPLNHCLDSYDRQKSTSSAPIEHSRHAHQKSGPFKLRSLERLIVESCPMLISLFTQYTAQTMTSLEDMTIDNCHGLKCLIKVNEREELQDNHDLQKVSMFPRLKDLKVENCDLMEYIFPISFARGLVKLQKIQICETPRLKYVFVQSNHEDIPSTQSQNKVLVDFCVENLTLKLVPNFISICSKNYYASCPSLQHLSLNYIGLPIMSVSNLIVGSEETLSDCDSKKDASHVKNLKSLTVESLNVDGIFYLEGLPIDKQSVISGLVEMDLLQLPELRYICNGLKNILSLESLASLTIVGCRKLKFVLSASVLRFLPLLESLLIVNCEELEQIIEEDDEENKNQQQVCFPKLTVLVVIHCNKLKRLFSVSTSQELPKLEQLIINEASLLEEVFGCELNDESEEMVEVMIPKLEHLILVELPSLTNVLQGNELQNVRYRVVHNCPKLTLTRTTTLWDLLQRYQYEGNEMDDPASSKLLILIEMIKANMHSRIMATYLQMDLHIEDSEVQAASKTELPPSQSFKDVVQESPATEKAGEVTSPQLLSSSSLINPSPQELSRDNQSISKATSLEQRALAEEKKINKTCYSDPQNVEEPANYSSCKEMSSSNTMTISLAVPTSFTMSETSLEKTSDPQISSVPENSTSTSMLASSETSGNLLIELSKRDIFANLITSADTSSSSMIHQPEFLRNLKNELAVYLDMSLDTICEENAFDNIERIVNSLARGTTNFLEKNILEDLTTRLRIFKERVPDAISYMESSSELVSKHEDVLVSLKTKVNGEQEKHIELNSTFSETCAEECEVEMEIQKLIIRKKEIIQKKHSLLIQLDQSSQALSKHFETWEGVREKLKLSIENWIKSKEDIVHANASWRIYKESLGL
ncbi:putative Receptor L-domain, winged helix-turn-helix DNA-binding domain-containing protein [Lupinus albus]|uniref:Putative Receptor L-domain, winged helix-turn-helix DNA-binding domain-containing protein n=1 Tax=Lupinus albus TaxID=3870 RepID=A0A6A4QKD5_LUPAL|nr:putative Receptor L-domain, winged helix-turn-helix DNA-binding domain-containing protein [Lupinus albus]